MECTFDRARRAQQRQKKAEKQDAVTFVRERLGIEPDEKQALVLTARGKRGILNCSRQWGKSTITAAMAVHRAYTEPQKLVLVASPSKRQSAEFVRKAAGMVSKLGIRPRGDGDNECSLTFPNGSRIVGLPGVEGTVRGFSAVSLLVIDEAARVADELYKALRPMLAVGDGDLWMMSTPWGKQGFFYETWVRGGSNWLRVSVPAAECPRIPIAFLEEERMHMGKLWFRQEYECEFVDNGAGVFAYDLVEEALDDDVTPVSIPFKQGRPGISEWARNRRSMDFMGTWDR